VSSGNNDTQYTSENVDGGHGDDANEAQPEADYDSRTQTKWQQEILEPEPAENEGVMDGDGFRVATLNFRGFKRVEGGLQMGCAQVRRAMADYQVDILVVT
jgi:hypothetical protein